MRVVESTTARLRTEHVPGVLPFALLGAALALALLLFVFRAMLPPVVSLLGLVLALLLGVGAWTQAVRTRFELDGDAAMVRWWRRSLLGVRTAEMPFDAVRQVVIQMGPGRRGDRARICLVIANRVEPLARDFSLARDEASALAADLRARLGLEDADALEARVRAAIARGDEAEAVRRLRAEQGLSEDQARELVKHLKES